MHLIEKERNYRSISIFQEVDKHVQHDGREVLGVYGFTSMRGLVGVWQTGGVERRSSISASKHYN